jgi:hypothetical protein
MCLIVLALVAAGCGGSDEDVVERMVEEAIEDESGGEVDIEVSEDDDEVSITISSEEGDASLSIGGGEIPADFPMPLPDGGDVVSVVSQTEGDATFHTVVMTYDAGRYDDLVAFFDDATSGIGDIQRTEMAGDERAVLWIGTEGTTTITVAEAEDEVNVMVTAGA